MSNAMKQLKHDVVAISGDTKLLAQRVTGVEGILGQLVPKISTLVGSVGTLSTNLDTVRQTMDGHWKDSAKTLQALGANLKANHAHWEQTTEKNQQYLVEGVKEVLKKVTTCDYESFTHGADQTDGAARTRDVGGSRIFAAGVRGYQGRPLRLGTGSGQHVGAGCHSEGVLRTPSSTCACSLRQGAAPTVV